MTCADRGRLPLGHAQAVVQVLVAVLALLAIAAGRPSADPAAPPRERPADVVVVTHPLHGGDAAPALASVVRHLAHPAAWHGAGSGAPVDQPLVGALIALVLLPLVRLVPPLARSRHSVRLRAPPRLAFLR